MSFFTAILDVLVSAQFGQAVVATILLVGTIILLVQGKDVPAFLVGLDSAAVTFYFTVAAVKRAR